MSAFLPALPSPKSWSHFQEYTVVSNEVFRELQNRTTIPENDCHMVNASELHKDKMFLWLPKDNNLWCIPISRGELERRSDCYLMVAGDFESLEETARVKRGKKARNEAKCAVALVRKDDHAHLGYYECHWYNEWVWAGGRPGDYIAHQRPF
ncbi:uncharacterized protein FMAN_15515 [Fusarium mangiferae]|uniref:Uncharacterized protein n=1 Tax=Fusarium mangiferae TaxID=192010 RepID=A0A1L7UNJ8_FUSMA|nr:uncharacterized protein FMAN_15515 [Fusarium mangiferae]CVL09357.1 uncharacterized protein FMAN_15515 [Fusarium mangiferae]